MEAIDNSLLALLTVLATLMSIMGCVAFTIGRSIAALADWCHEAVERNRWL